MYPLTQSSLDLDQGSNVDGLILIADQKHPRGQMTLDQIMDIIMFEILLPQKQPAPFQ